MSALSSPWELNDTANGRQPPLGDFFLRARRCRQHDADRQNELKLSPDNVHVVAEDLVFRRFSHENRQSLAHAGSPDRTTRQENETAANLAGRLNDSRSTALTATPAQSLTPGLRNLAVGFTAPEADRFLSVTP